jgi:hypothetical protein
MAPPFTLTSRIEPELLYAGYRLGRESFVDLDRPKSESLCPRRLQGFITSA